MLKRRDDFELMACRYQKASMRVEGSDLGEHIPKTLDGNIFMAA